MALASHGHALAWPPRHAIPCPAVPAPPAPAATHHAPLPPRLPPDHGVPRPALQGQGPRHLQRHRPQRGHCLCEPLAAAPAPALPCWAPCHAGHCTLEQHCAGWSTAASFVRQRSQHALQAMAYVSPFWRLHPCCAHGKLHLPAPSHSHRRAPTSRPPCSPHSTNHPSSAPSTASSRASSCCFACWLSDLSADDDAGLEWQPPLRFLLVLQLAQHFSRCSLAPHCSPSPRLTRCRAPRPPAGNFIRVKKVAAYQFTMAAASGLGCNETLFAAWKNETGFDEGAYQGESCCHCCVGQGVAASGSHAGCSLHGMGCACSTVDASSLPAHAAAVAELAYIKQTDPAAYWQLMQNDTGGCRPQQGARCTSSHCLPCLMPA